VAGLLFLVIFGVVESERRLQVYTTLASSTWAAVHGAIVHGNARNVAGGDRGSVPRPRTPNGVFVVQNLASAGSLNTANLTITVSYSEGTGSPVSRYP
jgi:hypothetical protein